jgi:hypothetical protein
MSRLRETFWLSLVRGIYGVCGSDDFLRDSDDFLRNLLDRFPVLPLHTWLQLVKDNAEQLNPPPKNWIHPELSRDRVLAVLGARRSCPPNHHL